MELEPKQPSKNFDLKSIILVILEHGTGRFSGLFRRDSSLPGVGFRLTTYPRGGERVHRIKLHRK